MTERATPCSVPERTRRLQAGGVVLLVVGTPLALGGVPAEARLVMTAGLATLFAIEWVPRTLRGYWPDRWERAWLAVWLVVSALIGLQLLPFPSPLLDLLGAYPYEFRSNADLTIQRLSPTPLATASYWSTFTGYWALAWMVARSRARDLAWLAAALVALGLVEALYGIYALVHQSESILGIWPRRHYRSDATGTFVNRNHFAGLLVLVWPLGLAWILGSSRGRGDPCPAAVRHGLAILFSLFVGAAVVSSHSRLGLVAALVGLASWLVLARREEGGGIRASRWTYLAPPAAALAGALWLGNGVLLERFLELPGQGERLVVWLSLLKLPARTWVLGAGAGSFQDVFKMVQPPEIQASYAHAHNDWLEFLLDFGIVGAAAVACVVWCWRCRVRPGHLATLQRGALGGVLAIAVHSLGDFNLQIPGTALAFWASVGIVVHRELSRPGLDPEARRAAPIERVAAAGSVRYRPKLPTQISLPRRLRG